MTDLAPGDVVRLWDRQTRPEKLKRHICICPRSRLFLRINTKAYGPPYHPLYVENCDFLEHDSFVELHQLLRHAPDTVRSAHKLGALSRREVEKLCQAVRAARTLTENLKDLICENLLGAA